MNAAPPAERPPVASGSCGLELFEVAAYQGVRIPLARDGARVATRVAPVIQRRPALIRAFVRPSADFGTREVELRLVLESPAGKRSFNDKKVVSRASEEATPASTFNFSVPAADIAEDTSYAVEVLSPATCADARVPTRGEIPLEAIEAGRLKVTLVPIKYDADGSGRLPDLSQAQLKKYRDYLMAMYPVESVQLTVRAPVSTTVSLSATGNWPALLDQMRALRARDMPATDVYYYGLVVPANTAREYCGSGCIAGIAYRASSAGASQRAGLGLAFSTGSGAVETMAHEIGHEHGRAHSPCGKVQGADAMYPHANGDVGVWGYDVVTGALIPSTRRKDIMGYCSPKWISDYTYGALANRSASVNQVSFQTFQLGRAVMREHRVLLLDAAGTPSWGIPTAEPAYGDAEPAKVLDARGALIATVEVYRTAVETDQASILVPSPEAGWDAVLVAGASRPLRFAEKAAVVPFGN